MTPKAQRVVSTVLVVIEVTVCWLGMGYWRTIIEVWATLKDVLIAGATILSRVAEERARRLNYKKGGK